MNAKLMEVRCGGDVITLSKRLGHATPQMTLSVYADEIEEANDNAVRKASVNALFSGTKMAARHGSHRGRQPATDSDCRRGADLPRAAGESARQTATATSRSSSSTSAGATRSTGRAGRGRHFLNIGP